MKALVCDDSQFMRTMVSNVLKIGQFDVVTATNGEDLIKVYEQEQPDVVTLDIVMNKVDGLAGLKNLLDKYPNACVVMVSAMGQKYYVLEAIKIGAKDFIVKPFSAQDLLHTVMKHVNTAS